LEAAQDRTQTVRRLIAVGQLLALVGRRDDAGLQLFTAFVPRLDATRHRILDRRRRIDGGENGHGRDEAQDRGDPDDVEAEKCGASSRHDLAVPPQMSKLTIWAMMKPPMLIQTRPPSPATISRSSTKNLPM